MGELNLSIFVRQEISLRALQHAKATRLKTGSMFSRSNSASTGLDTDHPNARIMEKGIEKSDGVASAANACYQQIRQTLFLLENLAASLFTDYSVQITHHHWVGMRAVSSPKKIMRRPDIRNPVTHCLVNGLLQSRLSSRHRNDLGSKKPHADDVERLTFHVNPAHIYDAFQAKSRRDGRRRNSVLTRAGLRYHACLTHALGQEDLTHRVIDFVCTGM